jgi:flagellar biogenesis protein FliO
VHQLKVSGRVQAFEKVSALKAIARPKGATSAITQLDVLLLFVVLTAFAVKKFRIEPMTMSKSSTKAA